MGNLKIYTNAYLDRNLGDDLMLRLTAQALPWCDFCVSTANPSLLHPFCDLKNIQGGHSALNKKINAQNYDGFLTVGGSMYILGSRKSVFYRYKTFYSGIRRFKQAKKPVAVCGCNLGLTSGRLASFLVKNELKLAGSVTLRDNFSKNEAQSAGINAKFYPDMLFGIDIAPAKNRSGLGISVYRNIRSSYGNLEYCKAIARIADGYINATGKPVFLFAFDCETENDLCAAHTIANLMQNPAEIIAYTGNSERVLNAIASCEAMLATRFHASVFALSAQVPLLSVAYSKKTEYMLTDIGCDNFVFVNELCENPDKILNIILTEKLFTLDSERLNDIKLSSKGHLKALCELFAK